MSDRDNDIEARKGRLNKVADEVKDVLSKADFSDMTSEEHTEFTSTLYSIVQQSTRPELQQNTSERQREDAR